MAEKVAENQVPRFKVDLAGQSLSQDDSKGVERLVVEDHVDMMGVFKATVNQKGVEWGDVTMGADAKAAFGGDSVPVFTGLVTGLRHHNRGGGIETVTAIAMDPLCKLGASRHTRIFEEQTDSDIVNAVLGEAGVDVGTVDSTSGTNKYVMQRNESDLVFLKRIAARNGYLLLANAEGKIDFVKAQFSGTAIELEREQITKFDYTMSHQTIPPNLTVFGWNYVDKAKVEGTASSGDVTTIGGGANGVAESGVIWQADAFISDVHVTDQGAAKNMAVGELNRLARQFVRGRATVKGNGEIRAGKLVKFKGYATGFNPEVFVVSSRHVIEAGTYRTEFQFVGNTKPQ